MHTECSFNSRSYLFNWRSLLRECVLLSTTTCPCVQAFVCMCMCAFCVITHRAIADIFLISSSDCSLYIGILQKTVWQHDMESEETTPRHKRKKWERIKMTLCDIITLCFCLYNSFTWTGLGSDTSPGYFMSHCILYLLLYSMWLWCKFCKEPYQHYNPNLTLPIIDQEVILVTIKSLPYVILKGSLLVHRNTWGGFSFQLPV